MSVSHIQAQYADFLRDPDFNQFQRMVESPNIFEVLRVDHYEIRHSNFLAWLFNPKGNHQLGDYFLRLFLLDLAIHPRCTEMTVLDVAGLDYGHIRLFREWKNIDLLIQSQTHVICIENKFHHFETSDQLARYKQIVEENFPNHKKVYVFLSKSGIGSTEDCFIPHSYESIAGYLDNRLKTNDILNERTKIYLEDYLQSLKQNLMNESEKHLLANKIYFQNKELLDFVLRYKSNLFEQVKQKLKAEIKERGWYSGSEAKRIVRFLPPELSVFIPKDQPGGWKPKGESFLYEVAFEQDKSAYRIYATISPVSKILKQALETALKTAENPISHNSWKTYFNQWIYEQDILEDKDGEAWETDTSARYLTDRILEKVDIMNSALSEMLIQHREAICKAATQN